MFFHKITKKNWKNINHNIQEFISKKIILNYYFYKDFFIKF